MRLNSSTAIISTSATSCARRVLLPLVLLALTSAGCGNDQAAANNQIIQQQQSQLERQQQEIESIKAGQNQTYAPGMATNSTGGCDKGVESAASRHGGELFASGNYPKALEYYQDALTACPNDDRAEVNVARTYEALGNSARAVSFYRKAADNSGPVVTDASEEARNALERLQASRLP